MTKGGSFSPKLYSSGWIGGSRARINTFSIAKTGKLLGAFGLGFGTTIDMIGVRNYYMNPSAQLVTHPGKASLNFGMAIYGLTLNPMAAVVYFGVDATIGWDAAFKLYDQFYQEQRSFWGDSYNSSMFKF